MLPCDARMSRAPLALFDRASDLEAAAAELDTGLERGKVVQSPSEAREDLANEVLHKHHAQVLSHHALRGPTRAEKDDVPLSDVTKGARR